MEDIGRQMIAMAFRWLPLIVVTSLAAGGIAFAYASSQQDVYEATGVLRVDVGPNATTQQYDAARGALNEYARDGESRKYAQDVIDELGIEDGLRDIQERVNLTADEESLTLEITAEATEPAAARRLARTTGNLLRRNVNRALITDQVKAANRAIRANQQLIDRYTNRLQALNRKQPKTDDDRAEMLSLSSLIPTLRAENIRLAPSSREGVRNRLEWIDPPRSPGASINRPLYWTLLAAVVGAMLGAALAFVLDSLRRSDRVRDIRDLEGATGVPALGSVVERRGDIRRGPAERLVMMRYPQGEAARAYRGLLTKIGFAASSARSLMVASPDGSERTSIVAANLALAYAEAGRTVLLVDADHRSPRIHQLFGVANDRGLTDLLFDRNIPLGFVTRPSQHPRLGLMPAGPPPSATAEALNTATLNTLLRRLLHAAEVVVFVSPSIADSLDATALAGSLDQCVLIVPEGADADEIVDAAATIERSRVSFAGAVLYRQVRGAHPREEAVTPSPPQVQWVPRADPLPEEPRLTAGTMRRPQEKPHASGPAVTAQPYPSAGASADAPNRVAPSEPPPGHRPPASQAWPTGPAEPASGNGHDPGRAAQSPHHAVGSAPSAQRPVEPRPAQPDGDRGAGADDRTGEGRVVSVEIGPYAEAFDPNAPMSSTTTSRG